MPVRAPALTRVSARSWLAATAKRATPGMIDTARHDTVTPGEVSYGPEKAQVEELVAELAEESGQMHLGPGW